MFAILFKILLFYILFLLLRGLFRGYKMVKMIKKQVSEPRQGQRKSSPSQSGGDTFEAKYRRLEDD